MFDFDDFYDEPSEFEQQIDEFKELLKAAVKDEFKVEMERLRNENAELHDVKNNFDQIKTEYRAKERELEAKMQKAQREARATRLADLMKDYQVSLYRADRTYNKGPKCDKCNEKRKIEFSSPSGKAMTEDCSCADSLIGFEPEEHILYEFRKHNTYDNELTVWYRKYGSDDDGFSYSSSTVAKCIYEKGMDFEKIDRYATFFKDKEDCQAYCDWLTEKESKQTV